MSLRARPTWQPLLTEVMAGQHVLSSQVSQDQCRAQMLMEGNSQAGRMQSWFFPTRQQPQGRTAAQTQLGLLFILMPLLTVTEGSQ